MWRRWRNRLAEEATTAGASFCYGCEVSAIESDTSGYRIRTAQSEFRLALSSTPEDSKRIAFRAWLEVRNIKWSFFGAIITN